MVDLFRFQNRPPAGSVFVRIIVGVSGASGSIYGYRLLEKLRPNPNVEVHLVLSRAGEKTGYLELGKKASDWKNLSDFSYSFEDLG